MTENGQPYTRARIKESFLRMLSEKEFSRIFVTDVCRDVGISRGTFYIHYSSLMDVLDDLAADITANLKRLPSQLCIYRWSYNPEGVPLCEYLRSHREFAPILADPVLRTRLAWRIVEWGEEHFVTGIEGHTDMGPQELRAYYSFQVNGCLAIVAENLDLPDEEWVRIRKTVDGVTKDGLERRIYRPGTVHFRRMCTGDAPADARF